MSKEGREIAIVNKILSTRTEEVGSGWAEDGNRTNKGPLPI